MANPKRKPLTTLQCPVCGREFQSAYWNQMYCSLTCKKRAEYQRDRTKIIARVHSNYDAGRQYITRDELEACQQDPRKARTIAGPGVIVCLECGEKLKTLSRHLGPEHGLTAAEYKLKPGPDGQPPRYDANSSLTSMNLYGKLSKMRKDLRLGHRLQGHRPPVATLIQSRGPRKMSLVYRLNRRDAMAGKGRPDLWKKTPDGVVTDTAIAKLRLEGMKIKDIAARVGIKGDGGTIHMRLRRMGFPPGRPCLFQHGEPITGRHIRDLCSDFGMTKKKMAEELDVSYSSQLCERARSDNPLPVWFAERLLKLRQKLADQPRHQGAPPQGGSSSSIPPSERASMYARYQELLHDFAILQQWLKRQGGKVAIGAMWDWLCKRSRERTIRLLFWPEFLDWIIGATTDPRHLDVTSAPQSLIQGFLAHSHFVSEKTIRRTLDKVDPEHQAEIRQVRPLLSASLTLFAGAKAMASKDLVKALKESDPGAWKDVTQIKLAQKLKRVGVSSGTIYLPGNRTLKGYKRTDIQRALKNSRPLK